MLSAIVLLCALIFLVSGVVALVQLFRRKWKSLGIWGGVFLLSFIIAVIASAGVPTPETSASSTTSDTEDSNQPSSPPAADTSDTSGQPEPFPVLDKQEEAQRVNRDATATKVFGNPSKWAGEYVRFPCKIMNVVNLDNGSGANATCGAGVTATFSSNMPNVDYSDPQAVARAEQEMEKNANGQVQRAEDQALLLLVGDKVRSFDGGQIVTIMGPVIGTTEGKNAMGATLEYPTVRIDYAE
jgi:hypothetical protein